MSDGVWRLWYDDQCEVCQAGLAWLRWLDRDRRTDAIPISDILGDRSKGPPGASEDELLRSLHVLAPDGTLLRGAPAVAGLARLFPATRWMGWIAGLPGFSWSADRLYGWIARHRYSLSRCRGGACRSVRVDLVRDRSSRRAFEACRVIGWGAITPLSFFLYTTRLARQARTWRSTRGRTATLLDGRLSIHYLGGALSSTVPLLFGELFAMVRYGPALLDPGGSRMRRSVERHLSRLRPAVKIEHVLPTHAHEEHCGNLELAASLTGATIRAHPRAIPLLRRPPRLPLMRRLVIGQPPPIEGRIEEVRSEILLEPGWGLQVLETPGHCDEHVAYYASRDRLLLVGDGFMGTHFSSPNDDVDHRAWIASIERLLELEVEIMVEAHGHVHTLRKDVLADLGRAGLERIASRRDPRDLLSEKLDFMRWMGEQLDLGLREGLSPAGLRATVFPWTQRWSCESAVQDAVAATVSRAEFGRHKVVRSFRRPSRGAAESRLPVVYELRWGG